MLLTTIGGISMTFLIFIRWMTGGYIGMAEEINMEWLGDDRLIVVKWGEDVIGSLVLGWADNDAAKKRGRRRRGKAVVRAWTVQLKYRGKGVGEGLLEEAVKVAGERGADGIVFDADHASKCTPTHATHFILFRPAGGVLSSLYRGDEFLLEDTPFLSLMIPRTIVIVASIKFSVLAFSCSYFGIESLSSSPYRPYIRVIIDDTTALC